MHDEFVFLQLNCGEETTEINFQADGKAWGAKKKKGPKTDGCHAFRDDEQQASKQASLNVNRSQTFPSR